MNKVLLLTTKYPCGAGEGWLTNELAECFSREGKSVSVLALSWEYEDGHSDVVELNGVKVYRSRLWKFFYRKNFICAMLKIFLFSLVVRFRYKRKIFDADLILATTPCIVIWGLLDFFMTRPRAKKYLILWDFFPYYMRDLWGSGRARLFSFFVKWENRLYNKFDAIGCMTKGSIEFLEKNYSVDCRRVRQLPLWTKQLPLVEVGAAEQKVLRAKYGIDEHAFVAVYGGAMSVVQGLDNILDLAASMKGRTEYQFVFIGRGPELPRLRARAVDEEMSNVRFINYVPRDEYEKIIAVCDVGIVSLAGEHAVPSFPSKSIDYLKVGLPVLASIDRYTEFGAILVNEMKAGRWVEAGDPVSLGQVLEEMRQDSVFLSDCASNGRRYYENEMKVELATQNIIAACEEV
ncbi:glycosyltransferase family 4 protein [Pseudomonas wayambapalatensis]|uniref:glycosyltransferase family 4 protein n=1 Tax=Pseudomonas wayambapalatensis TaxID=485895 RepID=UPI003CF6E8B5